MFVRIALFRFIGLVIAAHCAAEEFDPFKGPDPIVVFIQSDPWSMVIGADTPRVAVYADGEVVFAKQTEDRLAYHHIVLNARELDEVRNRVRPVLQIKSLERSYDLMPEWTDMPSAMFYVREGGRTVVTSVRGLAIKKFELPTDMVSSNGPKPDVPPQELLELHRWIAGLDYPNSAEWKPRYVEVVLWDYSYAPDPSVPWPRHWSALNSDRAFRHGERYSIFLDGSLLPEVRVLLASRTEKAAVEVEGRKMSMSFRFTFPQEPTWRRAFAARDEAPGK